MKPGVILTAKEADTIRERITAIERSVRDRRIKEQCRLVYVTINKGARRAARYDNEQEDLLQMIKNASSCTK